MSQVHLKRSINNRTEILSIDFIPRFSVQNAAIEVLETFFPHEGRRKQDACHADPTKILWHPTNRRSPDLGPF